MDELDLLYNYQDEEEETEDEDVQLFPTPHAAYEPDGIDTLFGPNTPIMQALVQQESGGNVNAVSPAGARGSTQVMPYMWESYGGGDITDKNEQLRVGGAILQDEYTRFGGNLKLALAAYNAGSPRVIEAMRQAGYSLKDSSNVPFGAIQPYLPEETKGYVPGVINNLSNYTDDSPYTRRTRTRLEPLGTNQELTEKLLPIYSDPSLETQSATEQLVRLKQVYASKKEWDKDAQSTFKELIDLTWEGAMPYERINMHALIGPAPSYPVDREMTPESFGDFYKGWKEQKLQELKEMGVSPLFLGSELDRYIEDAAQAEWDAANATRRGVLENIRNNIAGVELSMIKGGASLATAPLAALAKTFGFQEVGEGIDMLPERLLPRATTDFEFELDSTGHIRTDEYGQPIQKLRAKASYVLGNVLATLAGGWVTKALTSSNAATAAVLGGTNVAVGANQAYNDAIQYGGTERQAQKAMLYSLPPNALTTVADLYILAGGKAWINGLSNYHRISALAKQFTKYGALGAINQGARQYGQDIGTSTAIGADIASNRRTGESALGGGIAGGVFGMIGSRYAYRTPVTEPEVMPGRYARNERLGLPAPEGAVRPPADGGVPPTLPDPTTPQRLTYEEPPPRGVIEGESIIPGFDTPDAAEQLRLVTEFQKMEHSPDTERVLSLRSPIDVTNDMLEEFGLRAEVTRDGHLRVRTDEPYLMPEVSDATPLPEIDARMETLVRDLASLPDPEDIPGLLTERRKLQQEIADVSSRAKAEAPQVAQLSSRAETLTRNITELKRARHRPNSNKRLINTQLAEYREELKQIKEYLKDTGAAQAYLNLSKQLLQVTDALRQLENPAKFNKQKAYKEAELANLAVKREVMMAEQAATAQQAAKEQKQPERQAQGIPIETPDGIVRVVKSQDKWYVTDNDGRPLSKGTPDVTKAFDIARGIADTSEARGFDIGVIPRTRGEGVSRPLKFLTRIKSGYPSVYTAPIDVLQGKKNGEDIFVSRRNGAFQVTQGASRTPVTETRYQHIDDARTAADKYIQEPAPPKKAAKGAKKRSKPKVAPVQKETKVEAAEEPTVLERPRTESAKESTRPTEEAPPKQERVAESRARAVPKDKALQKAVAFKPVGPEYTTGTPMTETGTRAVNPRDILKSARKLLKSLAKLAPKKPAYGIREGGRSKSRSASAYIDPRGRYIRLNRINAPEDILHEVSHAFQFDLFPHWGNIPGYQDISGLQDALLDSALTWYPNAAKLSRDTRLKEGWAKFIEHYVTNQPVHKKLLDFYNTWLKQNYPDVYKAVEDLKKESVDYFNMNPFVRSKIFTGASVDKKIKVPPWSTIVDTMIDRHRIIQEAIVDTMIDRHRIIQEAGEAAGVDLGKTVHNVQALSRVIIDHNTSVGFRDFQGNEIPGMFPLTDAFKSAAGQLPELDAYLVAKRTLGRLARGQTTGFPVDAAKRIITDIESKPEYRPVVNAANKVWTWQDAMLGVWGQTTEANQEIVGRVRASNVMHTGTTHGFYVPFAREFTEEAGTPDTGTARAPQTLARYKGSDRRIASPISVIADYYGNLLSRGVKDYVTAQLTALADAGTPVAAFITKVPKEHIPVLTKKLEEILKTVNDTLVAEGNSPLDIGDPAALNTLVTFYAPEIDTPRAADGYVNMAVPQKGGTYAFYEVPKRMYDALTSDLPDFTRNWLFEWLVKLPRDIQRVAATSASVAFQARNLIRDPQAAYLRRQSLNPLRFAQDVVNSFVGETIHALAYGKLSTPMTRAIKTIVGQKSLSAQHTQEVMASIHRATGKQVSAIIENTASYLDGILSISENTFRDSAVREWMRINNVKPGDRLTMQQQIDMIDAYNYATGNYLVQGSVARGINLGSAFFTARIANTHQALTRDPVKFASRYIGMAMGVFAVSVVQALRNMDEEYYQNLSDKEKFTNVIGTIKGDTKDTDRIFGIPLTTQAVIPYAMGQMFVDQLLRADILKPHILSQIRALTAEASPINTVFDFLGTIGKEVAEQLMNYDTYYERDIEPKGIKEAAPAQRYTAYTTEFSKALGAKLGISPIRIDHGIQKLVPAAMQYMRMIEGATGAAKTNEYYSNPLEMVVGAFVRPGSTQSSMSRARDMFYDARDKYEGNKDFLSAKEDKIRIKLNNIATQLSDYNKVIRDTEDRSKRARLEKEKRDLLMRGIRISQGEALTVPDSKVAHRAEQITATKKKEVLAAKNKRANQPFFQ